MVLAVNRPRIPKVIPGGLRRHPRSMHVFHEYQSPAVAKGFRSNFLLRVASNHPVDYRQLSLGSDTLVRERLRTWMCLTLGGNSFLPLAPSLTVKRAWPWLRVACLLLEGQDPFLSGKKYTSLICYRTYRLEVVQHPERSAEFGSATLSRLPLSPPLIVQLRVRDQAGATIKA